MNRLPIEPRPIPTKTLVTRLETLSDELANMEQGRVDTASLNGVCKDLIQASLIMHKDKGIKILTACCIADVLKLFAPDAPYTLNELKEVFELFISQLRNLADTSSTYFAKYYYLLEQLSTVKSIILVTDLDGADELLTEIFQDFFKMVQPKQKTNIYPYMLDILSALIEECQAVPQDCFDLIVSHFKKKKREENPKAFQLAVDLCNACPDKLQRYFFQHFADIITTATSKGKDDKESGEETESIEQAHKLLMFLNQHCPSVLLMVIPLVEEEMQVDNDDIRMLATSVLGEMFAEPSSRLAIGFRSAWKLWLQRRNDKNHSIRLKLFEFAPKIYKNHPELANDLSACLEQKLRDPDDKVRLTCIKVVQSLDLVLASMLPRSLLVELGERCRDKKVGIRSEAIIALSKMYKLAYNDIIKADEVGEKAKVKFEWIPGAILDTFYLDDAETLVWAEKALDEDILTHIESYKERTERLLNVLLPLQLRSRKAFVSFLKLQAQSQATTAFFLDTCVRYNGGIMDDNAEQIEKQLKLVLEHLTKRFSDPHKAQTNFMKFAKMNEARLYKLIRVAMDPKSEYKCVYKSIKETQARLKESPQVLETLQILLRRVSFLIISKETIPALFEHIRSGCHGESKMLAETLIKDIVDTFPTLGKTDDVLQDFAKALQGDDENLATIADGLEAYARVIKRNPEKAPTDCTSLTRLANFIRVGSTSEAKYAMAILANGSASSNVLAQLLDEFLEWLRKSTDGQRLESVLSALGELARYAPAVFDQKTSEIVDVLFKDLLRRNREAGVEDEMPDWVEVDHAPSELCLKLAALRVLVKRLMAIDKLSEDEPPAILQPVLKLLRLILDHKGLIFPTQPTCEVYQAHLRREAAIAVVRLNKRRIYNNFMELRDYERLAVIAQDKYFQVREGLYDCLRKQLDAEAIPNAFLPVIFYCAHEPDEALKHKLKAFVTRYASLMKKHRDDMKRTTVERYLIRFIHLLAHDDEFDGADLECLQEFTKYFTFYFDCIASQENVSYLYRMIAELKQVKDKMVDDEKESSSLYILSELAQKVLQDWCSRRHFTLDAYSGKLSLPKDLFERLVGADAAMNVKRVYLPSSFKLPDHGTGTTAHTIAASNGATKAYRPKRSKKAATDADEDDKASEEETEGITDGDSASSFVSFGKSVKKKQVAGGSKNRRKRKSRDMKGSDHEEGDEGQGNGEPEMKVTKRQKSVAESPVRKNARRAARSKKLNYAELDDESQEQVAFGIQGEAAIRQYKVGMEPSPQTSGQDGCIDDDAEEERLVDPREKRRQGKSEADKENGRKRRSGSNASSKKSNGLGTGKERSISKRLG
ncbi:hypothetical protein SeMB42_g06166 [Synchytrium endobioticum]|uniref:Sister chromatid cohesion protein PDS5 n=1 Tax=Synchytrium endobioticum TaxID=286115 RepID=A0A507CMK9_9FUNG|nr:hypothetical protein SeMB42_g06166 [Synchytrium endobioticum]